MQNTSKSELNLATYNNLSHCCENCFRDSQLISEIQIMEAAIVGCCSFCSSTNAKCIEPDKLSIYFEMLLGAYSTNDSGTPLTELIQNDWAIFNEDIDIYIDNIIFWVKFYKTTIFLLLCTPQRGKARTNH